MYRVGFTPWDNDEVPAELAAVVDGDDALPPGRALDIGCGTGTQAVHLARAGWKVTGIDAVEKPLVKARRRAADSGVAVDIVARFAQGGSSCGRGRTAEGRRPARCAACPGSGTGSPARLRRPCSA